MKSALAGLAKAVFSLRLFAVIKIVLLDVILQVKVARDDFTRWLMNALIFCGFMGLLLLHALDGFITEPLFSDYQSTLNPFFYLRNLLGLMVVADYMGLDDPEEAAELKVYWAEYYGVVFDDAAMSADEEMLSEGQSMHEESCLDCHDRPASALVASRPGTIDGQGLPIA